MNAILRIAVLGACLYVAGSSPLQSQQQPVPRPKPFSSTPYDERLNMLDREALEIAYRNQIAFLFQGWMKDSAGQPHRALAGTNQARRAFVEAMTELDRRSPQ